MCSAQQVLERLSRTAERPLDNLISSYLKCGGSQQALSLYERIKDDHHTQFNEQTYVALLKACTSLKSTTVGTSIHAHVVRIGILDRNPFVGSSLIDMYAKCGYPCRAQEVFDKLLVRDLVCWTALTGGYVEHGFNEEALDCLIMMQDEGIAPDAFMLVSALKACGTLDDLGQGQSIHIETVQKGCDKEVYVASALVDMYARCNSLPEAHEVLIKLPARNMVTWTALITGYVADGCNTEALQCFQQMQCEGFSPGVVTFVCSLKACAASLAKVEGREIHTDIVKKGLEEELSICNSLIDMYAKCGGLVEAKRVFDQLLLRDVVSCNALIAAYSGQKHAEEALKCLDQMHHERISPNLVTFASSLKACSLICESSKGQVIHAEITWRGLLVEDDDIIGNALLDMYAKCALLVEAKKVFDELRVQDVVSWTTLIAAYTKFGHVGEALKFFEQMQGEGIAPGSASFVCSLKACAAIGSTDKGEELHSHIIMTGLEREPVVGNMIVDMYSKCGLLATAKHLYHDLEVRDIVSCNALITGYAQLGESKKVIHFFNEMMEDDIKPDLITFISVLNAFSHAGLLGKGFGYFELIYDACGVVPNLYHYTCLIDLFGRSGDTDKALEIINNMPFHPNCIVWHTLFMACRKWGKVELGEHAFEVSVELDETDDTPYTCMGNIYMDAQRQ